MRRLLLLMSTLAALAALGGCSLFSGHATIRIIERNVPASVIMVDLGIDVTVRTAEGEVVAAFRIDSNSPAVERELKLPAGDYVATAVCPMHEEARTAFHLAPSSRSIIKVVFSEIMMRGRVTYFGEVPPDEWRDDIVVELWGYDDFELHNAELLGETGVDDMGRYLFVIPPDRFINPVAYVEIDGTLHIAPGWVQQYGGSEDLVWALNYSTF